ncbi:unnamed protein product, partial [Timema podura]|nr:unnamed protein product [Timema podura]
MYEILDSEHGNETSTLRMKQQGRLEIGVSESGSVEDCDGISRGDGSWSESSHTEPMSLMEIPTGGLEGYPREGLKVLEPPHPPIVVCGCPEIHADPKRKCGERGGNMQLNVEECIEEVTTYNSSEEEEAVGPEDHSGGSELDFYLSGLNFIQRHRVPFPELGMDIID